MSAPGPKQHPSQQVEVMERGRELSVATHRIPRCLEVGCATACAEGGPDNVVIVGAERCGMEIEVQIHGPQPVSGDREQ